MNLKKAIMNHSLTGIAFILSLPLIVILVPLKYIFHIQFVRVRTSRIGPAGGIDFFLRCVQLGIKGSKKIKYIGLAATITANEFFFKMNQRSLSMIKIPQSPLIRRFLQILATKSLLYKLSLFEELKFIGNEYNELNNSNTTLYFMSEEEKQGKELIQNMHIPPSAEYVCIHARDTAYLDSILHKRDARHDFRNCSIENYLNAAEYLSKKNFFVVRMGAKVEKPLNTPHKHIIDYASKFRTDFGDIYLITHCKFYLGNTAGLSIPSYLFKIPVANANIIPLTQAPPPGKKDLFIPKKIWSTKENRLLTFKEMIYSTEIANWQSHKFNEKDGLIPIENTAEEILDLAIEMNERLDGTWQTTPEDEELQHKFKLLFDVTTPCYGFPSRIGAKFLREHKHLLK